MNRRPIPLATATLVLLVLCSISVSGQQRAALSPPPQIAPANPPPLVSGPVLPLYRALRAVALDPQKVYTIRDADLDREDVHISLNDGTIAFTQGVRSEER